MTIGGPSGFAPPPGEAQQDLEHYFTQIKAEIEDALALLDSDITVSGSITIDPGSDTDQDLIVVDVTGSPTFSWDETFGWFNFDNNVNFAAGLRALDITVTFGDLDLGVDSVFGWGGYNIMSFDDNSGAEVLGIGIGVAADGGGADISIFGSANPGGQDVAIGDGNTRVTTTTEGFFLIPVCTGTPTGTPDNAGGGYAAMIYDNSNHEINIYSGSWRSVAVT